MMPTIIIPGECVPKGRPRFTRSGHAYTPKKTKDYEKLVQQYIKLQRITPTDKPVKVEIVIYKSVPKSWSKKKKQEALDGIILPIVKPDLDNYLKSILDASNGLLYADDNQIIDIVASKRYASMPYVEISLEEVSHA